MNQQLSGLRAWLVQRLSALYMLLFLPLFLGAAMVAGSGNSFVAWRSFVARPAVGIGLALFFLALLLHAWVGVRDVILDYAGQRPGLRLVLLSLLGLWLLVLALWLLKVIAMVML